jgi:hypothetical protein
MFFVEATEDKYLEAITLLKHSLFHVEFTEERAKTVISQLVNIRWNRFCRYLRTQL